MVYIKPFKGIRPVKEKANKIASYPYDVVNREEAKEMARENPLSFLHIVKPEIDLPDDVDDHAEDVYKKGRENYLSMLKKGILIQDDKACFYVYAQTMNGKTQYGLVAGACIDDYFNNRIKKHELTRPDKEEDRKNHIRYANTNYEPVFFSYPANQEIDAIIANEVNKDPLYDFVADDGIGHHLWVINNQSTIEKISSLFADIPATYVADGHHRTAAAALVGKEKKQNNPHHTGKEEYNFFLAVHFPDNQLSIIDYNRVVKDLNGLKKEEFLEKLNNGFDIRLEGKEIVKPDKIHTFTMYLDNNWYSLKAKSHTYNDNDPIDVLDVTILTNHILDPVLDIKDLRTSKKIDFVGGIRGLKELQRRVDSGEMQVAFALYPVSMQQLINIADTGNIMPPKTTWFEPKLRSGLIIHSLDEE